jgi:hypothetical protein
LRGLSLQARTRRFSWERLTIRRFNVTGIEKEVLILSMVVLLVGSVAFGSQAESQTVIRTRVVHEDGTPVAGAEVIVLQLSHLKELTDDSGWVRRAFSIPSSSVDEEIMILATHDHYYPPIFPSIEVGEGYSEHTIVMKTLFVDGYVVDTCALGLPIEDVVIRITNYPQPPEEDTSDSQGHFRIESKELRCTTPRTVEIVAKKEGCSLYTGSLYMIKENQRIRIGCACDE